MLIELTHLYFNRLFLNTINIVDILRPYMLKLIFVKTDPESSCIHTVISQIIEALLVALRSIRV